MKLFTRDKRERHRSIHPGLSSARHPSPLPLYVVRRVPPQGLYGARERGAGLPRHRVWRASGGASQRTRFGGDESCRRSRGPGALDRGRGGVGHASSGWAALPARSAFGAVLVSNHPERGLNVR